MKIKFKRFIGAIFLYVLLTAGLWMFMTSYSESYNRLTTSEKISPASVNISGNSVEMTVLREQFSFSAEALMPESKMYYFLYMAAPDEARFIAAAMLQYIS